jgi:putative pyruvate formate lyase activating enzyme
MYRQASAPVLDENGLITSGLIVRHLILPGCADDSMRVLDWIAANLPGAWVSLMAQYTPAGNACDFPEIDRRLTKKEYGRVVDHLFKLGLDEGYVQELSSADERYVPAFDLTGV